MTEPAFHHALALGVIALGVLVFGTLLFIPAPYGRHARGGWGPTVSARLGWLVMESPAALVFLGIYAVGAHARDAAPLVFLAIWLSHYGYRAFVFPFRLRAAAKPMPFSVVAMAIVFNAINAYLNARTVSALGDYGRAWLVDPRFVVGALAFFAGMALNRRSDAILLALRAPGDRGYRIPHGGAYRFVSSPNYLGEMIEWAGWAVATWSLAGLAFFVFTAANLVPRAIAHHRWYRETFPDYPRERRAVIPFVL